MAVIVPENRFGRLIGIALYFLIIIGSFLDFSEKYGFWIAHSIMTVAGLILLFVFRLLNLSAFIESLSTPSFPVILNFAVYVLTQLGSLILIVGYVMFNANLTKKQIRKVIVGMMIVAIVFYVLIFIMECVLMIGYRMNIDLNLKLSLLSRVLFLTGFVGTAVCLMLPDPKRVREEKTGQFLYSEDDEDEIEVVI
jgi:hypothetical protein